MFLRSDTLSFLVEPAVTLTILDPLTGKTVTITVLPPRAREVSTSRHSVEQGDGERRNHGR